MMRTPILAKDLDIDEITYKPPMDFNNGGRVVHMNFADGPIILQTANMFCPFGLKDWEKKQNYTLDLSFKGRESDPKVKAFFDKINELDEKLISDCVANGVTWLKKPISSKEVASIVYTKQIRYTKDKTGAVDERFPPTFKVKVPFKDGEFIPDVYDSSRNLIDLNDVETKGSTIVAIIQCMGLWVADGKFGCSWKIMQMRIVPPVGKKFAFVDLDDEDDVPVQSMKKLAIKPAEKRVVTPPNKPRDKQAAVPASKPIVFSKKAFKKPIPGSDSDEESSSEEV